MKKEKKKRKIKYFFTQFFRYKKLEKNLKLSTPEELFEINNF